jgi:hypothetical protein
MVSANRNEYTVSSVYIYTRAFVSKENGVEVMKAPCQYCQVRHMGCHGSCEKYIDFTKELAVKREEQRKAINTLYEHVAVLSKHKRSR